MGVHLTLNAEWAPYRWGPVSTREPASGLLDDEGYFHAAVRATAQWADPCAVAAELRAQVGRALQAGIDVTHVDSHMGALIEPSFLQSYVDVALENRLPLLFLRGEAVRQRAGEVGPAFVAQAVRLGQEAEARGLPLFDAMVSLPLDDPADH